MEKREKKRKKSGKVGIFLLGIGHKYRKAEKRSDHTKSTRFNRVLCFPKGRKRAFFRVYLCLKGVYP